MYGNSGGLRTATHGIKMDDSNPEPIGNSVRYGSRERLFWGAQDGRDMGSAVQYNHSETLDGSFLTLGFGVDTETRLKNNEGALNTHLNTSHSQSGYGSFVPPGFKMAQGGYSSIKENAAGSSSIKHNLGGHPSIEQNVSGSSNVTAFPGLALSVADAAVGLPSTMQNASSPQMLPNPQSHVPYPFLTANIVQNQGFQGISGASSNIGNCGWRPSIVQNASESSNLTAFPGSAHSVDTAVGSTMQNASPLEILRNPQSHVPCPFVTQGHQKFGAGFANIGPYQGFHCISGASSNGENLGGRLPGSAHSVDTAVGNSNIIQNATPPKLVPIPQSHVPFSFLTQGHQNFGAAFANIVPSRGFCGISGSSSNRENCGWHPSIMQNGSESSNLTAFPSSAQSVDTAAGLPSTMQNASPPKMLPNPQSHAPYPFLRQDHQNLGAGSANIVPNGGFHGFCGTSSFQEHLRSHSRLPPSQSFHALSGMSPLSVQEQQSLTPLPSLSSVTSGQLQKPNTGSIPTLQRGTTVAPVFGKSESTSSQSGGNGPAIPSNRLSRSSLKRGAAQPPSTTQVQKKKTTKHSPYPSLAYPVSSVSPVRVTTPPIRATTIPSSARTLQSPHIKRQAKDPFQPSGYNCFLCKRDLSYKPEGPISPSAARPIVAVLSCGHSFHDLCLQRVTPEDQANDPPCIPCAIGED